MKSHKFSGHEAASPWIMCCHGGRGTLASNTQVLALAQDLSLTCWLTSASSLLQAMAPHSSTLAWKISWMEEPGRLQPMGSLRVGHDWVTSLSLLCIGEGNGNPLQCSCLENPRDGGAWWAAVYGVAQSRTWLKRLGSTAHLIFNVNSKAVWQTVKIREGYLEMTKVCIIAYTWTVR